MKNHATKTVASIFGILVGLAGIEHGIFEILQGDVVPNDIIIDAIGSGQKFWEYATETALTVIPNFLIAGIFAVIFGFLVTIWAAFIDKKTWCLGLWPFGTHFVVGWRRFCTNFYVNIRFCYCHSGK